MQYRAAVLGNVDIVRRGYEYVSSTGEPDVDIMAPDFVWDMSHFHGWPEQQIYEGVDGTRAFLAAWTEAWDDWEIEVESVQDSCDQVLAITVQRGRSKSTGVAVEMRFAQLWTLRDGRLTRMEMYSDPVEAVRDLKTRE
jgi:ketosteroid isomerase-like protein